MSRGVLYIVWGEAIEPTLQRSLASLKEAHPELPVEVVRLPPTTDVYRGLLEKSRMLELSPFDETLFLDADTIVLDRLDFGFAQAARHQLACCICECPWARRYRGMRNDDIVEYNTGVLFFTREVQPLFRRWNELVSRIDSSIEFYQENGSPKLMPANDQAAFAKAVELWDRMPFVLPLNWNYRPAWSAGFFGPLKIWHDYNEAPAGVKDLNAHYRAADATIRFHAMRKT